MESFETLDYENIENEVSRKNELNLTEKKRRFLDIINCVIYIVIGITVGCAAFLLKISINYLSEFRQGLSEKFVYLNMYWYGYCIFLLLALVYASISAFLINYGL